MSQSELDSQIMQRVLQALKAGIAAYKITAINIILVETATNLTTNNNNSNNFNSDNNGAQQERLAPRQPTVESSQQESATASAPLVSSPRGLYILIMFSFSIALLSLIVHYLHDHSNPTLLPNPITVPAIPPRSEVILRSIFFR